MLVAAALMTAVLMLAGCRGVSGAEAKVSEDLESLRFVELDPEVDAEIKSMLSEQGREYYEMFLGKAGEFEYQITGRNEVSQAEVVHVRITTYDFASEYLKSWSDFLESSSAEGSDPQYDSAVLYETLFRNLSNIQKKEYTADVDIICTENEDGSWQTDAAQNTDLRNAILGGMISEISSLAGLEQ